MFWFCLTPGVDLNIPFFTTSLKTNTWEIISDKKSIITMMKIEDINSVIKGGVGQTIQGPIVVKVV